ncbi:hypothetical protein FK482_0002 [Listeria phage LP-013]|uniref:Portal protein n=1 Tax=Listeria phage LP-013 TaxID=2590047 RepID=A0A514U6P3_9CAUD|nr:hypothetical protein FK482_0002 [Listeria phage LP-013]
MVKAGERDEQILAEMEFRMANNGVNIPTDSQPTDYVPRGSRVNTVVFNRKFIADEEPNIAGVLLLIQRHSQRKFIYKYLHDYYIGNHDILKRTFNDKLKPNNKLVHNYPKLIVETANSYFTGNAITYAKASDNTIKQVTDVMNANNSTDVDSELGKLVSIYGHAFEIHWTDKNANHRFKYETPSNAFIVYDSTLDENKLCGVVYNDYTDAISSEKRRSVTVYYPDRILQFKVSLGGGVASLSEEDATGEEESSNNLIYNEKVTPHYFGEVPMIEYLANDERLGDFETVIGLVDALNLVVCDSVNDVSYWNDAYLMLTGMDGTNSEDVRSMKQNRVMVLVEGGDAKFITKQTPDKHLENIKNRLTKEIMEQSFTPDTNGMQTANNLSGVAIKYALNNLEIKTSAKQRKFEIGLHERINLIATLIAVKSSTLKDAKEMSPVFTRCLPASLAELADTSVKFRGLVSNETLLHQIPFVTDVAKEMKQVALEKQEEIALVAETSVAENAATTMTASNVPANDNSDGRAKQGITTNAQGTNVQDSATQEKQRQAR